MQGDIATVLFRREQIARRVVELAGEIARDLLRSFAAADANTATADPSVEQPAPKASDGRGGKVEVAPGSRRGRDGGGRGRGRGGGGGGGDSQPALTIVPILTGSIVFLADLIRYLPLYMRIRLLSISSYPGRATTSRGAMVREELSTLPASLAGSHVLLIDDILDSGHTLTLARDLLAQRHPASLRTCVLLRKRRPEAMACPVDYVCFDIPDAFVVGYGLDFNDYYRNLPDIVTLRPEVTDA